MLHRTTLRRATPGQRETDMLVTEPFWRSQFPRPADLSLAPALPERVDVAIVGSGYTGLNAARVLALSGASVSVIERETIGWGASSRNGGMVSPGLKCPIEKILERYGEEQGRRFWQASLDAIELIDEIVVTENIECDWHRNGYVVLAFKPAHFRAMRRSVSWYRERFGHEVTAVPSSELHGEIGSGAFHGGLLDTFAGGLQPAKFVYGLARAVTRLGVALHEKTDVQRITRRGSGLEIATSNGVVEAGEVLVATNGYTDNLVPALKPRVFPVGSYIIVTEPLSLDLQAELSPKGRMFCDSKNFLNYFRLTPDGRMLWGGRNDLSTDLDLHRSAEVLTEQMVHTFPQLEGIPVTHSWTGKLGITFDLMPHVGRVNGIHYAFGYGGHGLSIATYLGTEVGKLLSGEISSSPFAEIPHPTMFFYRNEPWFRSIAARYYRLVDWLM